MRRLSPRYSVWLLLLTGLAALVLFPRLIDTLKAQEHPSLEPKAGRVLVARPSGVSDTFHETVVLLLEAGEGQRTWGLVLNRVRAPDEQPLPQGVDRWGGPVHPAHRITLTPRPHPPEGARRLLSGLSWYETDQTTQPPADSSLAFAGVSAWGPGQLEQELALGAWWVVEVRAEEVFTPPGNLWAALAARHL
ncbi:YqgE/AlgH family protein [Myxococcus landrumensis]|uniref:YqgE/AlgH family protein n=1 Tax=Myxococcus landrumensis TaxID=2813577 RepID=A0ABX7NA45_9BACT|nr:YqgE/AlgH family protein [Myxococcus landrumus]QSQ13208.1 YqgE/AlgH family protein [Myxococcus landrumus]